MRARVLVVIAVLLLVAVIGGAWALPWVIVGFLAGLIW